MATALRFAFIFLTGLLLFMWLGRRNDDPPPETAAAQPRVEVVVPDKRAPYQYCDINTDLYRAQLTSRGATLKRFELKREKYQHDGKPYDVSTTPQPGVVPNTPEEDDPQAGKSQVPGTAHEFRQQLFFQFRNPTAPDGPQDPDWNVAYDSVDWTLGTSDGKTCEFRYSDSDVSLTKVIRASEHPYELLVTVTIENKSDRKRQHAAAVDTTAWWLDHDVEPKMFRVSPFVTNVECIAETGEAKRLLKGDFDDPDLEDPGFAQGPAGWYQASDPPAVAGVSNAYFSHALIPLDDNHPACQLQIEFRRRPGTEPGAFYRARLAYPTRTLEPGESATYDLMSYIGPKERNILESAANRTHQLTELINLGFFSAIAKVLVAFLLKVHSLIPNWGIAIIILTVCARVMLFPLSIPSIRTMVKMQELKPEIDKLNEKYKDDMRAKGVAQMELFRKHGMSPFDQIKGCLPQMATMPVWFALYTTLQTAVELYNIPFLWFPDLSKPDPYFVLPFVIGGTYFLQQKIMPFTGDPAQRKMMMYFMPGMFTVFMLFLPAGLGVYMFTNSLLAIVQQQGVHAHMKRASGKGKVEVMEKEEPKAEKARRKKGKRKRT
jgi:YidC/Oxa1 family membrane protein insertase